MRREIKNAILLQPAPQALLGRGAAALVRAGCLPLNFQKFLKKIPAKRVYKLRETVL